jgi:transcriptional regulator with XRE-family HTH domain
MITTTVVDEIRRMLQEGRLSQRNIARRIGVSRGTVNAIALGRRVSCAARRRCDADGFTPPAGVPVRCPGCGARVQMPCLLCYIRTTHGRRRAERSGVC